MCQKTIELLSKMLNNKKYIYIYIYMPTSFNLKILSKTKLINTTKLKNFIFDM